MSLIPYTAGGGQASAALLTFASSGNKNSITTASQTYSSQGIGMPSSDRVVLVSIYSKGQLTKVVQSITCGGVSMTKMRSVTYTRGESGIWGVAYPTGTTADIVVTYPAANISRNFIAVHALTGTAGDFTEFDFGSDSASTTMSTTLDIPANGAVLVTAGSNTDGQNSADAGFTEDWQENNTGSAFGGSASLLAAETARTITSTTDGNDYQSLVAVSFGP